MVYTHPRYLPGSRLDEVRLARCVVADGVMIERSTLESSIAGVRSVIRGATVVRSLVMGSDDEYPEVPGAPPVGIGEGSVIEDAIIDKNARVGRNVRIAGGMGIPDSEGPGWVRRDGIAVVEKNAVIPDGTTV
jgi:glucose-1-phosphate adenylyltransferase